MPPTLIVVRDGACTVVIKGEPGLEDPSFNVTDPPLLPVSCTSGPFSMLIMVPWFASTSKMAGEKGTPILDCTISPVTERDPSGKIITVPPVVPRKKVPNINPCSGLANTAMGRGGTGGGCVMGRGGGGGCCAFTATGGIASSRHII